MQQFITSSESCALLERILQTVQSLNQARASLFGKKAGMAPSSSTNATVEPTPPMVAAKRPALPIFENAVEPVAPVLTIKLADLIRAGAEARERRNQHVRLQRPVNKPRQQKLQLPHRSRTVEVLYKRTHRMAS